MDLAQILKAFTRIVVDPRIIEELTDFLIEAVLKTDLRRLITEDGAWERFVEAAELSSLEAEALRDALEERLAREPMDENDRPQREQQKERFLREFPQLKRKLEDHIRKLRDLADHLDKVHKDCTISNVVSSSVGATSGVLGLTGLILAPFTLGASLALSAASLGLGAAASVTSLTTSIVEESNRLSDESEARRLVGASTNLIEEILKIMPKMSIKLYNTGKEVVHAFRTLKDQIRAIRTARSISRPGAAARNITSTGRSVQGLLPMTRAARIRAGVFTSLSLGWDVYNLVNESQDLYDGAKTESAGALRDLAHNLEEKLQVFEKIYKDLKGDPPLCDLLKQLRVHKRCNVQ
ncbi:apolipoprotein L3-like isoform X2 [Apodemus sylvaticus]|uniref:apolipoprotein L3-like isoform X2 n=2 Tax=Apodemus sylvaticus TaxID=10129 RepID=UPI00224410A1|nr:apolipoprotein L3-like isoform X2 [Apodemus sylvaticus]XP_052017603.1 apolipoprotein L3-like isoform X2 [Apodemus sylvaticus]XP_052017604.1 apolipoprotein L3-like isoform X2 [Apodemus sylvaticus]XP_052017605.1 apolipoprotein L3-like isoform X2 [Apodemus sylvaticus]XP_052017633.1 apolipoprotein L3-like isoform X2 [Apodemus sylvaticus]XP_052017634.1 apolipoprotein L3-like isoform X2 [Apodemus sylvaticus]XP_052017635.1 apolipoprotein L3-like isoform X2 [Apodemus sylvaticus]